MEDRPAGPPESIMHAPTVKFPTPPILLSEDWAGSIGKRTDPDNGMVVAGWTYDCNPYGHTKYATPCPNMVGPHAIVYWWEDRPDDRLIDLAACIPLVTPDEGVTYHGAIEQRRSNCGPVELEILWNLSAYVSVAAGVEHAIIQANLLSDTTPPYGISDYDAALPYGIARHVVSGPADLYCTAYFILEPAITPNPAQLAQRDRFAVAHADWIALSQAERKALNRSAARRRLSGYNLWMQQHAKA